MIVTLNSLSGYWLLQYQHIDTTLTDTLRHSTIQEQNMDN